MNRKSPGLSATLSLRVGLVTQADGGGTSGSQPGAWLGARPPRRCCRPGQPWTPVSRSYVLVLTGTTPGLHSSKHPRRQRALSEGRRPGHRPTSLGSRDQTEGTRDAGRPDISPLCDKDPESAADGRQRVKMIKHSCVALPGSSPTAQRAGGRGPPSGPPAKAQPGDTRLWAHQTLSTESRCARLHC